MSSYHIVNAVWVGIFPMLAVMIIIGILFYFLCCLNQIKNRIIRNRKRRILKRNIRLNSIDKKTHDSLSTFVNDECQIAAQPDRSKLFLDLKKDQSQERKFYRKSGSAGDLYMARLGTPIECLVVEELNESPKSLYSRMQSLNNLKNGSRTDNPIPITDTEVEKEKNLNSPNSFINDDSFNDYDNDSSSSSFSKNREYRKHFMEKIKKRNEKKKSKSSNQLKIVKFKNKFSSNHFKNNRLSSDIDYGDELFNDDDSLSSTGFSGSQSKSIQMLFKYDSRLSTFRKSDADRSLNLNNTNKKLIQNSVTLNSLNHESKRINFNSIPKAKSAGFDKHKIVDSSSLSDMDPDDSLLKDILIKTPKLSARKNVNFVK